MKPLITSILIVVAISNIKGGDYSINNFLKYLQETGIYDLFAEIKKCFGVDICINFCKELYPNTNKCSEIVRVYINVSFLRALRNAEKNEPCVLISDLPSLNDKNEEEKKNCVDLFNQIIDKYLDVLLKAGFNSSFIEDVKKRIQRSINDIFENSIIKNKPSLQSEYDDK